MSPLDSLEDTRRRIEEAGLRDLVNHLSRSGRCNRRAAMIADGYRQEQINELLPLRASGRPGRVPDNFKGISSPLRVAIAAALGLDAFPLTAGEWDSPAMGSKAAEAITEYYSKSTSATGILSVLRTRLREIGAPEDIVEATKRAMGRPKRGE